MTGRPRSTLPPHALSAPVATTFATVAGAWSAVTVPSPARAGAVEFEEAIHVCGEADAVFDVEFKGTVGRVQRVARSQFVPVIPVAQARFVPRMDGAGASQAGHH